LVEFAVAVIPRRWFGFEARELALNVQESHSKVELVGRWVALVHRVIKSADSLIGLLRGLHFRPLDQMPCLLHDKGAVDHKQRLLRDCRDESLRTGSVRIRKIKGAEEAR